MKLSIERPVKYICQLFGDYPVPTYHFNSLIICVCVVDVKKYFLVGSEFMQLQSDSLWSKRYLQTP